MTTIAGLIRMDGGPCQPQALERMQQAMDLFQPETRRSWRQGPAGLLSSLRRFTPEDAYDRQPLQSGVNKPVLLFCGRLDNRQELVQALSLPLAQANGWADSALVQAAWSAWGEQTPGRLLGNYALAVWDPAAQRLFLARDPLGLRPLYWHLGDRLFAFASGVQVLHALPEIPRELDEERLADYLALSPRQGPGSFFRGIQRLEPGQSLVFQQGRVSTAYHHRFDPELRTVLPRDEDYVEAFREQVERAVHSQLRAVGPVAAFLSSGFDSSTVCAVAAGQLARQGQGLLAYTHVPLEGFDGPVPKGRHGDEGPGAAALARRYPNIEHILVHNGASHLAMLEQIPLFASQPLLNTCNGVWYTTIPTLAGARGARVVLSGELGNMGLSYHGRELMPELLRQGRWGRWFQEAQGLRRRGRATWRGVMSMSLGPYLPIWLWGRLAKNRGGQMSGLFRYSALRPEVAKALDIRARAAAGDLDISYRPWADGRRARCMSIQRVDLGDKYLNRLYFGGVDERAPLMDVRLLEFCLAIPMEQFMHRGLERWILHRAYDSLLPPEIREGLTKGYQAADWYVTAAGERQAMMAELDRLAASPVASHLLDIAALRRDIENWPKDGWENSEVFYPYRLRLLRGLSVGVFIRKMEGGND